MTTATPNTRTAEDFALLQHVVEALHASGDRLLHDFTVAARPAGRADLLAAVRRNEKTSLHGLARTLAALRPRAGSVEGDLETTALPDGEWCSVDAVEGNVNHVHGLPEWSVTVTLLRDDTPVLTAVYQPVGDLTYTAVRGGGAGESLVREGR